ncbi:MAG TPA: hypothetical protein VFF52_28935 [Isosphaeraceae bacterium]|nr:hypothetical protein [Isosphaeraceae bacterium]
MAATPSHPAPAVGGAARWTSRLRSAAEGKFGLLLVALVALMGAAPLIPSSVRDAVLTLFTGAVLVASLHAARPGGRPTVVGLALALADCLIGRCTVHLGTRWLVLLQTVLWMSTLIYVIATILRAIFASREVTVETLLAALCVLLLMGLFGAFAFTLIDLMFPGSFRAAHGPGLVWTDERSRTTEFMRLFIFSYATLSGSNCAEVTPATGFARNAASLEAMTGQIYLAVVIARLVGLHVTPPPRDTAGASKA